MKWNEYRDGAKNELQFVNKLTGKTFAIREQNGYKKIVEVDRKSGEYNVVFADTWREVYQAVNAMSYLARYAERGV